MATIKWRCSHETIINFRTLMVKLSSAEEAGDKAAYWETVELVKMLPGFPNDMNMLEDEVWLIPDKPLITTVH